MTTSPPRYRIDKIVRDERFQGLKYTYCAASSHGANRFFRRSDSNVYRLVVPIVTYRNT